MYQGLRYVSFSKNFTYVLYEWSQIIFQLGNSMKTIKSNVSFRNYWKLWNIKFGTSTRDLLVPSQQWKHHHWCHSGVFIVNFERIPHIAVMLTLLTLSKEMQVVVVVFFFVFFFVFVFFNSSATCTSWNTEMTNLEFSR